MSGWVGARGEGEDVVANDPVAGAAGKQIKIVIPNGP
jgi:hypothetical protein